MREVAIERHQTVVTLAVRQRDTLEVGAADAGLAGTMNHPDAPMLRRQRIEEIAGPVGRAIVHEQEIRIEPERQDLFAIGPTLALSL